MTVRDLPTPQPGTLKAAIFDVDSVLLTSPHEQAWREALTGFADLAHFTTALYQAVVAAKQRLSGARAALEALGVPDAERQAIHLCRTQAEAAGRIDCGGKRRRLPRRASFRSGGGGAWLADGGRIVL